MSSRIRILFFNPNYPGSHVGNKALIALEKFYLGTAPQLRRRQTLDGVVYEVPDNSPKLTPIPAELRGIERARWIWEHLPAGHRKVSKFEIVRESRSRKWSKQQANPWNHGIGKQRQKKKRLPTQRRPETVGELIARATPLRSAGVEVVEARSEAPRLRLGIWA